MCFTFQEYKQAFWLSTRAAVGKVGRIDTQLQIEEMCSLSFARFLQRLKLATISRCQAGVMTVFMQHSNFQTVVISLIYFPSMLRSTTVLQVGGS